MWDFQSQFDILACKMVDAKKGCPKEFQKKKLLGLITLFYINEVTTI
jgi:hypothetical protein